MFHAYGCVPVPEGTRATLAHLPITRSLTHFADNTLVPRQSFIRGHRRCRQLLSEHGSTNRDLLSLDDSAISRAYVQFHRNRLGVLTLVQGNV